MQKERIVENAGEKIAPYFQRRLKALEQHPLVGQVRGVGLLGAIQLVPEKPSNKPFIKGGVVATRCRDYSNDGGLIMRAVDDSMILSPPLVISEQEIDELFNIATDALDQTYSDWQSGKIEFL